ncbi:hypothetical protein CO038_02745 [Candidatus Pacearchaeota archaeon CG_4_9_14_0_2_um_filter_39_13]|nr:HAD family phosphatase [Candidatus Pacearchaeota archaeon]OIO43095.1 MAG: hypothetical protein AUJ64_02840 [Candidatus Pacearchaeota archaeon CG1_02_39_14]PJC44635.1 MAG: hypothetical protein CO038_02745 [Candidatus Pacearchaeota archaeon CG_4_9_14_0_2_um_filter_39_13]
MKEKNKIKAVIFDIGGVLQLEEGRSKDDLHRGIHESIARFFDLDLDTWFDAIDSVYAKSIEGTIKENTVFRTIARNINSGIRSLQDVLIGTYENNFKRNNELFDFAFKLKRKYKIAILSDQWHASKRALIKKEDARRFNVVVVSCDVGMRKPNPKIYKLTLKRLKMKPEEAVFIDNRDWNIIPAKKLGMKTVLFRNNKQTFRELKKLGVKI